MMRFPSIDDAVANARFTARRFPFVLTAALLAAFVAMVAVDRPNDQDLIRLAFATLLGIAPLLAITLTSERRGWARQRTALISAAGFGALAALYFWSGHWSETLTALRFAQLALGFHLLAAFLPFLGGTVRGFWQHNRIMFLRLLVATLYAGVLFGGLAIAIAAIDQLFGVNIDETWYLRLWLFLALVFHPWFFLAGLPRELAVLDTLEDYPNALKVFAQFVLVPLVTVYLLILTAYLLRIIVTTTWPRGWIGYLVSSVAATGTLALLLVHPIREREDARWVDAYSRWFFIALLPSIGMLYLAIGLRLGQYGFTENRYFLLILTIWLTGIALYYGLTRSRDIRWIPITLCVVALLTFWGPWSAYSVARRSQSHRLIELLERHRILSNAQLTPARDSVPFADAREISATVRYLYDVHGPSSLAAIHPALADTSSRGVPAQKGKPPEDRAAVANIVQRLGVDYVSRWERGRVAGDAFNLHTDMHYQLDVSGFDTFARVDLTYPRSIRVATDSVQLMPVRSGTIAVRFRGRQIGVLRLDSLITAWPAEALTGRGWSPTEAQRTIDFATEEVRVRIVLRAMHGSSPRAGRPLQLHGGFADVLVDSR